MIDGYLTVGADGNGGLGHAVDHGHHHQVICVALDDLAVLVNSDFASSGFGPAFHDVFTAPIIDAFCIF